MGSNNPGNQNPVAGAITFPARSERAPEPLPVQPRQPRNLQGLLRFAMEATKVEDAPADSQYAPMDEERRRFLEQALQSLTVDLAEVLRKSIATLSDPEKISSAQLGQDPPADVTEAFDQLEEIIDDIDVANDFYKLGGFSVFPVCFGSDSPAVRARAAAALAELCQNNPFCQARALETGLLNVLLHLVDSEEGHTLAKCLYALSCACREFEPSCRELIAQGGCGTLARLLADQDSAVRTKAAFFTRYLAQHYAEAKAQFISNNIVNTIVNQLEKGRDSTSEHLLSTLLTLTEGLDPAVMRQMTEPKVKKVIQDHLKVEDAFAEEKEYAQELIKVIECCRRDDVDDCVDR